MTENIAYDEGSQRNIALKAVAAVQMTGAEDFDLDQLGYLSHEIPELKDLIANMSALKSTAAEIRDADVDDEERKDLGAEALDLALKKYNATVDKLEHVVNTKRAKYTHSLVGPQGSSSEGGPCGTPPTATTWRACSLRMTPISVRRSTWRNTSAMPPWLEPLRQLRTRAA